MNIIKGNIVDVVKRRIYKGEIYFNKKIVKIVEKNVDEELFILPGLIDSHMHIESTMLSPSMFGKEAVKHGTVAVITDPHEIANVCGEEGIKYMISDSKNAALKIFFGVPSCVPATNMETSGASIDSFVIEKLFKEYDEFVCLSEMMNYPGVVNDDPEVIKKIQIAKKYNKPIDGHAPALRGENLKKYIQAGIFTDHECFSIDEAREKIKYGMKILIREGSAAKNLNELLPLFFEYPENVMFCTDDIHPDDLLKGHINLLLKEAWNKGYDYFDVLRAATYNPVKHYNINVGLLQENDDADFIISKDKYLNHIISVYIKGENVLDRELKIENNNYLNNWGIESKKISLDDIKIEKKENKIYNVIECIDGELFTNHLKLRYNEVFESDGKLKEGFNKIVCVNRYFDAKPVAGIIKNFGIRNGAIGSTVAHDSHNIIICGDNDCSIINVFSKISEKRGGIAINYDSNTEILPLPIAGLMTDENVYNVAIKYQKFNKIAKEILGTKLTSPFMTLSFMALLVIPELKISDKGLFNSSMFKFIPLFE